MEKIPALNEPTYGRIRDRIREEILAGIFKPGERLRMIQLADRYQVSQMPIREALQSLQGEGLVELIPNRGASVRRVNARSVSNMYDIRGAIESMLARRSAKAAQETNINTLADIERQYEMKIHAQDYPEALKCNRQFHRLINELADNDDAVHILEKQWELIHALRRRYSFGMGRLVEIVQEHRLLIEALRAHDEERAAAIALKHSQHAKDDLLKQMQESAQED